MSPTKSISPLAIAALTLASASALAYRQDAHVTQMPAAIADEFKAYCNDGSLPSYSFRESNSADPNKQKSWVVFFQGGGTCTSDERCIARWNDSDPAPWNGYQHGPDDHEVGGHLAMTSFGYLGGVNASGDFDGGGILDFDGIGPVATQALAQKNPFDGFNRLYVHYCSSDDWKGKGAVRQIVPTADQVAASYLVPPTLPGGAGNIRFAGANIADAMITMLMRGLIGTNRVPSATGHEIVIAGSSAGAAGVTTNLDALVDTIHSFTTAPQIYGVIDSVTAVTSPVEDRPIEDLNAVFWSGENMGGNGPGVTYAQTRTEWDLANHRDCRVKIAHNQAVPAYYQNPYYCSTIANLVRTEIETPFFVSINSFDTGIHASLLEYEEILLAQPMMNGGCSAALDELLYRYFEGIITDDDVRNGLGTVGIAGLPGCGMTLSQLDSVHAQALVWVRNSITESVVYMGEGTRVGNGAKRFGYYVPNYTGLHQLLADGNDQRFFYTDYTATVGGLDPQMGVSINLIDANGDGIADNGDGGISDNYSCAMTLGSFRDMILNPALLVADVDPAGYKKRNDYWMTH